MKKLLMLFVIFLLLLSIKNPIVAEPREQLIDYLNGLITGAVSTQRKNAAMQIRGDLFALFPSADTETRAYLEGITQNNNAVHRFYASFCAKTELNPYFYGSELQRICRVIEKYNGQNAN